MIEFLKSNYHKVRSTARVVKRLYWFILNLAYRTRIISVAEIPIVINNFNRLTFPLQLIRFLERCGLRKIVILDNNSTYPPLLEFYEKCPYLVVRSEENYGHLAFWKSGLYHRFKWNYFVYTDADVVPVDDCPKDFMVHFKSVLDANPRLDKIGFGIKIDDLPDSFSLKKKVVDYESKYWRKQVKPNLFDAPIDTTFALYRPLSHLKSGEVYTLPAYRFGYPYVVRHLPWYEDSLNRTDEEMFYIQNSNTSSSIAQHQLGGESVYG